MVPAPIERSEVWGHDNRSENLQHLQRTSMSSSLSRFSGWRSRSLSLGEGLTDSRGMAPALMVCWIEGGAVFFLFSVLARRRRRATGSIAAGTWRRRPSAGSTASTLLSALTRARGARRFERALRQTDLLEPPGRRCGCWSTSSSSFWRNCWLADSGSGPTMELRRSLLTSASPGRGGGDGAGADRAQRGMGS